MLKGFSFFQAGKDLFLVARTGIRWRVFDRSPAGKTALLFAKIAYNGSVAEYRLLAEEKSIISSFVMIDSDKRVHYYDKDTGEVKAIPYDELYIDN